jgi:DNA-binding transcriptional ArsR family regulator
MPAHPAAAPYDTPDDRAPDDIAPDDRAPVPMPELPLRLSVSTPRQLKAFGDPTRVRILNIIQNQPATAKQIAGRLGIAPGTIGHHLGVLERAGLARVTARRVVRGIVAKYYTRTARIFTFDLPHDPGGSKTVSVDFLGQGRGELAEAAADLGDRASLIGGLPHARLASARMEVYRERLLALIDDLVAEPPDPEGQVYGLCGVLYVAPAYMQTGGKMPDHLPAAPPDARAPGGDRTNRGGANPYSGHRDGVEGESAR